MKYRKLEGWKYQLMAKKSVIVAGLEAVNADYPYIKLKNGCLTVAKYYSWDGATGVPDNPDNMRASLFHDALYQLMQLGLLDRKYRDVADQLLRSLCLEDGMDKFWADQFYNFVHAFGEAHTLPPKKPNGEVIEI